MALRCKLFAHDRALAACAVQDSAHIIPGAKGDHVSKIQMAIFILDDNANSVSPVELRTQTYGPTTAAAVLAYKTRRNIINRAYQSKADNIVGKMTIAAMDREMLTVESMPPSQPDANRTVAVT